METLDNSFSEPEPLADHHQLDNFDCSRPALNEWLHRRARRNEREGASRTYVLVGDGCSVVAYYSLAAGSITRTDAPSAIRRNMPEPVPVVVLGRLAIDHRYQGHGLGAAMLRDATERAKAGAGVIGARALMVHALDDSVAQFYQAHGFVPSPVAPRTMMIAFRHI